MLTACDGNSNSSKSKESDSTVESIQYEAMQGEATYNGDIVKSVDAAKEYANIVMKEIGQDLKKYKVVTAAFDSNSRIWVINYGIDEETMGGDVSIAIAQKTGEIKQIWFGE